MGVDLVDHGQISKAPPPGDLGDAKRLDSRQTRVLPAIGQVVNNGIDLRYSDRDNTVRKERGAMRRNP